MARMSATTVYGRILGALLIIASLGGLVAGVYLFTLRPIPHPAWAVVLVSIGIMGSANGIHQFYRPLYSTRVQATLGSSVVLAIVTALIVDPGHLGILERIIMFALFGFRLVMYGAGVWIGDSEDE